MTSPTVETGFHLSTCRNALCKGCLIAPPMRKPPVPPSGGSTGKTQ